VKYLILLGDGMADVPLPELGGKTPLEAAHTPAMDHIAQTGATGLFCPIPEGLPAGSDIGNLSMFGYDPRASFRGRAPIEAANQGITLAGDEVAYRCNLVTLEDGRMKSFTSDHISTEEARELVGALNEALGTQFPARFHTGVSYRHLCIVRASGAASVADMAGQECEPPHNITDREVAPWLPKGAGEAQTRAMMAASEAVLADHPVNRARIAAGKLPATSIWLWGQGKAPVMQPFREKFGLSGAVVSAVDLVMGIGVLAGLEVLRVPGATGWIDTNYDGKVRAALDALDRHDFAYVHLEAPDETAHQGRADLKVQAISDFDSKIVQPVLEYCARQPDTRVLVAPDHFTLCTTKTHAPGPVPFCMAGPGVPSHPRPAYSEREAAQSGVLVAEGHSLTARMLRDAAITL
jgi:2,3-bisphosphoglycerate-independent phosphoglycerate mutase